MARWKEKRKRDYCTKFEHIGLELKVKDLEKIYADKAKALGAIIDERNIDLQRQRNIIKDLEGALTRTSLLLEIQAKQFKVIKEVLSFFEPDKALTATEKDMLIRGENGTNNRTNQDSSRAKS